MWHWIGDDRDVHDTIVAGHHAQALSRIPERWDGAPSHISSSPGVWGSDPSGPLPWRFWPSMHLSKYDGETNLDYWFEDYCLAMKAGWLDDDFTT